MHRLNSEGIPRDDLAWALTQPKLVKTARRIDACLLCRSGNVNEAGLCDVCTSQLDGEEKRLVENWRIGMMP